MARRKTDTRSIGLDVGLAFSRFLTGRENLHYGLWEDGAEVCAANLGAAQEAYTDKLFGLLPEGRKLSILDIGGGAGETAKKLVARGHSVDIVIPSPFLAGRCRENAGPGARVHEARFEDFETDARFDICLFSESFQYIPLDLALDKALSLLAPGGAVIVADCFRTDLIFEETPYTKVGGGHLLSDFRTALDSRPLDILHDEDITTAVAPTVEVEQALFNVIGYGLRRGHEGLAEAHPLLAGMLRRGAGLLLGRRRRERLDLRLNGRTRSIETFCRYNRYLLLKLAPKAAPGEGAAKAP